jgi:hypothetical protein
MPIYRETHKAGAGTIGAYDRGTSIAGDSRQLTSRQSGMGGGAVDDAFLEQKALTKAAQAKAEAALTPEQRAAGNAMVKSSLDAHAQGIADLREHQSHQSGFGLDDFIGSTIAMFALAAGAAYGMAAGGATGAAEAGAAAGGTAGGTAAGAGAAAVEGGAAALAGGAGAIPAAVNTVTVVGSAAGGVSAGTAAAIGAGIVGAGAAGAALAGGGAGAIPEAPMNTVEVVGQAPQPAIPPEAVIPGAVAGTGGLADIVGDTPPANTVEVVGQRPPLEVPPMYYVTPEHLAPIVTPPIPSLSDYMPGGDNTPPAEHTVTVPGQRPTVAPPLPMQEIDIGTLPPIITPPHPDLSQYMPTAAPTTPPSGSVTTPGNNTINLPGLGGLGDILKGLLPLIAGNRDRITNEQDSAFWKDQMDRVTGFYKPGTPEAELMRKKIEAKDAAAGRNSQYGVREMDLAGILAQQRANIMTSPGYIHMADAYRGHYSNSLDSMFNALSGFPTSPSGAGTQQQGLNSLMDLILKNILPENVVFSGSGGKTSGAVAQPTLAPTPAPTMAPQSAPATAFAPTAAPAQLETKMPDVKATSPLQTMLPTATTSTGTAAPAAPTSLGGLPINTAPTPAPATIPMKPSVPLYQNPTPTLADIAAYGQENGGDSYAFLKGVNDYNALKNNTKIFMDALGWNEEQAWANTGESEAYWKEAQRQYDAGLKPSVTSMKLWKQKQGV